jgi:RecB family exonuclease
VGAVWQASRAPGLDPARPLSPSRIATLLHCPHLFLLQNVLGLDEPPEPRSTDRIEPLEFGTLVHGTLERLFTETGGALCRREGALDEWLVRAGELVRTEYERFLRTYPLRGRGVIASQRRRFLEAVRRFVAYEWQREPREFVASELDFGDPRAVPIEVGGGATLYLRGKIDRIDRLADGSCSVRDYKTGKAHPLSAEPIDVALDLQIALYARVVARGLIARVAGPDGAGPQIGEAVYVYATSARDAERRFDGDALGELDLALDDWLALACALLADGTFPRTPDAEACRWCAFRPHCGGDAAELSAAKLSAARVRAAGMPAASLKIASIAGSAVLAAVTGFAAHHDLQGGADGDTAE